MRTEPQPRCPNCDAAGAVVYSDLRDRVYGAPGLWRMRRCGEPRCGVYWIDPAPHPDDLGIAYRGYHTHDADPEPPARASFVSSVQDAFVARTLGTTDRGGWLARQFGRLLPLFPDRSESALYAHFYLPVARDGKVLEVGCGAGRQLEAMVRDGWTARGVDFDPEAVATAQARGLDVSLGDVRDMDLPDGSFDAVVMAHVIEHVFDPVGLIARCARLLRPGGRLISITPNADSLGHRLFGRDWRGLEPPRHIVVYTARGLRLACERAGLTVDRVRVTARDAANMLLASRRIGRAAGAQTIRRPQWNERPPVALRLLAGVEHAADLLGVGLGEELVLTARRRDGP